MSGKMYDVLQDFRFMQDFRYRTSLAADRDAWADLSDMFVKWCSNAQQPDI